MILGIVGAEEKKFTERGRFEAQLIIGELMGRLAPEKVVSGGCHLGGIDIWAIDFAKHLGIATEEFLPEHLTWQFYKKRNLEIARVSDEVHCIAVNLLPDDFVGMTFPYCYHHKPVRSDHVKSGGCWTMNRAIYLGKVGELHIVRNY